MLSIKSAKPIVLHTGDLELTYKFSAPANSSDTANDGTIAYGRTVNSVAITVTNYDTGVAVTDLVDSSSVSDNIISITLSYPPTSGDGRYKLKCIMTLDSGSRIEWATNQIFCEAN